MVVEVEAKKVEAIYELALPHCLIVMWFLISKKISASKNYLFCNVLIIGKWWANTSRQFIAKEIMITEL